ncbi:MULTISPECIES: DMT family transporter [unclassified Caballeronia]|uniref:DMT family transporter n=1 Tax=unclassified Caballeronia TaxID=2646786 RepID=UPI0020296563|nr:MULTISPECIES: DMT family transporter [unclassified Caballeronia]MDR5766704.1 DMT family transporter [Caballeronia sp. LZ028]
MPFIVGCALLGTIGVFLHEANADPLTATWFRCAFGLLGMSAWLISRGQTRFLRLTRSNVLWVLAASLLMVSSWALFFSAVERISAGVAIVLFHVQPMWVLLFASLWLKETIGGQRVMAVAVAMCGLVLATGVAGHASDGSLQPAYWTGVAACLAGSLCMAGVTIIARRLRDLPAGVLAWWQCAIGTLLLWIWPMQHGWPAWGMSWAWLAGLGLIHTGFAYTLMYVGMARLDTARVAVLQFVYPAVAIVIDWLVFDQRLSGAQMTGIALMSVAIGFAERVRKA